MCQSALQLAHRIAQVVKYRENEKFPEKKKKTHTQVWFESSCFLYAGQSVMMIVKTETIPPYDP